MIVNLYIEFAELQAKSRKPMYMADWISKLDDFMKISGREILEHVGKISHEIAIMKANDEYSKFSEHSKNELSPVEKHFLESIDVTSIQLKEKKGNTKS